jgi:phosphatidylglycerol:prolipoprotein diacylglycerol transferase
VLLEIGGLSLTSYGLSKALAALVAWWMIARELGRRQLETSPALALTLAGVLGGFAGAKLYYLAENAGSLTLHDLGGTGFTWYGGLIGGATAVIVVSRLVGLPLGLVAGVIAAPLAIAYGIGQVGCLLAGDGTYGVASDVPWAISFPDGTVPTLERVHPTNVYEALGGFLVGALLLRLRGRVSDGALFGLFAVLMGLSRFLVEFVRRHEEVVLGLTQPQLWSVLLVAVGIGVGLASIARSSGRGRPAPAG